VPVAPAAVCKKCAHGSHHEPTATPGIPARNGFNGILRALPGDEFLFVTVIGGLRFAGARSGSQISADLAPATGARTTRFCRTRPVFRQATLPACARPARLWKTEATSFVRAPVDHSRAEPALRSLVHPTLLRSPHPIPTSVTTAIRPSCGMRQRKL
jgi:hypothetical protein